MNPTVFVALVLVAVQIVFGKIEVKDQLEVEPEFLVAKVTEDGLIQIEDLVLTPEQFKAFYPLASEKLTAKNHTVHRRAANGDRKRLWPGGRIPYKFGHLAGNQDVIIQAMNEWQRVTCVRFVPMSNQFKYYVTFESNGDSCWANLGYTSSNTKVNLGPYCFTSTIALHEIGHVLGLIHEHQHPDRDRYINIHWQNVEPGSKVHFDINPADSSYGVAYDPESIMHALPTMGSYPGCQGSNCITMSLKSGGQIKYNERLSPKSDIASVNRMYCSGGK